MARRKAARAAGRAATKSAAGRKRPGAQRARKSRRAPGTRGAAKKTARSRRAGTAARKRTASRKAGGARKTAASRSRPPRKTQGGAKKQASARRSVSARKTAKTASRPTTATTPPASTPPSVAARKPPALERERRVLDEDIVKTPPSTLNLDRPASAVRTGQRELRERYEKHTETGPTLTGGDVDADWESAYSVGDEAPGGDNPTPDQDIVDEIGRAVGVEYQDTEELKGVEKVQRRDRHRWELDPASSEDWDERG